MLWTFQNLYNNKNYGRQHKICLYRQMQFGLYYSTALLYLHEQN